MSAKINKNYFVTKRQIAALISVAILFMSTVGCASINRLREAQEAFNQAAAAENALRFDSNTSDVTSTAKLGSVRSGYASALLSLDKIESADEKSLRQDGLWGSALTLKALCQWRLGLFPQALASAEEAQKIGDQIYPRDLALVVAIPGLIKTDQAYDKILNKKPLGDVEALLTGASGAIVNIQKARNTVDDEDHPVQIYLIQAQLAAYRNFMVAQDRLNGHATVPTDHPARVEANKQLSDLNKILNKLQPGPAAQALIIYWARLCALDMP